MKAILYPIDAFDFCGLVRNKKMMIVDVFHTPTETPLKIYFCRDKSLTHILDRDDSGEYGAYLSYPRLIYIPKCDLKNKVLAEAICYKNEEKYDKDGLVGWNELYLKDLVVYDEPKDMKEFYGRCPSWFYGNHCGGCKYFSEAYGYSDNDGECVNNGLRPFCRTPKKWKYVNWVEGQVL